MKKTSGEKGSRAKLAAAPAKQKNAATAAVTTKAAGSSRPKSSAKPKTAIKAQSANDVAAKADKPKAKLAAKSKIAPALKEKIKKPKLIRDSFTMPETEYAALGEVKKLCLKAGIEVKKSELLRIGVAHIRQLSLPDLKKSIASLTPLKAGRPKKEK